MKVAAFYMDANGKIQRGMATIIKVAGTMVDPQMLKVLLRFEDGSTDTLLMSPEKFTSVMEEQCEGVLQ